MSDLPSYNLIVIGAGIGGYPAAIRAAQLGARVLVIDKSGVGGTCLNKGCIPTKAFKATSDTLLRMQTAEEFGLTGTVNVKADIRAIVNRKNRIVGELVKGVEFLFKSHGVEMKRASATFLSKTRLQLTFPDGTREIAGSERFIIGTGSSPADLPGIKTDGKFILNSDDILNLDTLPKRLIIIGAGVIGTEFAFIFKSMGVEIVMLEIMPKVLPAEDEDIAAMITRSLKKSGISVRTNTRVTRSEIHGQEINLYLDNNEVVTGDMVLVSVGRSINTDGLGLENTGVRLGGKKEIVVDKFLSTGVNGIYACGDVTGGRMLAHVAYREGITAVSNLLQGSRQSLNYDAIPSAVYSTPEAAGVGLTEAAAREKGLKFRIGKFPYRALGKARAFSETDGEVKIIVGSETDRVLGMHVVGAHATDIIAQGALAIQNGLTIHALTDTVAAHPTYSEAVMEAGEDVFSMAVHQPKKLRQED